MQFSIQLATLATLFTSVSAWRFTGYKDSNYNGGKVIERSGNGLTNNLCVDIIKNDNVMSSFKWTQGTNYFCEFKLYNGHGCKGTQLAHSESDWNVPQISDKDNNKASSLWVDCI